ncbi:uncharacterized protein PITG_06663 [Phytophthora infestans T30-4]|uniref:Transcription factor CBF/NF-Y/archaeal histone domain-containing protein n=1 Tax=Phytophthora infestans (strain T30-4) TaxID=403677 RepID=D0N5D6_PHYIT|nr:uncharacterized protein PITG_06663 [Phytophthora infestans T30-4]EEY70094.1 hypothetical protein PITG_06663 [Phytophthora infestans T30-4]|eukprot:XP_002998741.1 hypothetical protein PITG_06663 [Phytophthora infestans T30-4]
MEFKVDIINTLGSIEKLLREVVGDDIPISKETVDWVNECAGELLQIVGQEANMIAESISTKENYRISHEHVVTALEVMATEEEGADSVSEGSCENRLTRRVAG